MTQHKTVSRSDWLAARRALLAEEKEFTKLRDQLAAKRRALPWIKVDQDYVFDGPDGRESLGDLFAGRRQLLVYHFMFGPDWEAGCPSCSYLADHFDGAMVHLAQRDISFAVISRGPLDRLQAYRQRMGWRFKWLSSAGNDFNFDFHVSFTPEEVSAGRMYYNYGEASFPSDEGPGMSAFYRDEKGDIFHTYSCYARGLDMLIGAYNLMDLTALGRDEGGLSFPMAWVRRHDSYD